VGRWGLTGGASIKVEMKKKKPKSLFQMVWRRGVLKMGRVNENEWVRRKCSSGDVTRGQLAKKGGMTRGSSWVSG